MVHVKFRVKKKENFDVNQQEKKTKKLDVKKKEI